MEVSKDNQHFRGSGRRGVGEVMGVLRAPHSQWAPPHCPSRGWDGAAGTRTKAGSPEIPDVQVHLCCGPDAGVVACSSQIRSTDRILLTPQPAGPHTKLLRVFPTHCSPPAFSSAASVAGRCALTPAQVQEREGSTATNAEGRTSPSPLSGHVWLLC